VVLGKATILENGQGSEKTVIDTATKSSISKHKLRILLAMVLVILTVQGWFGDTTNLFVTTGTTSSIAFSFGAIISQIISYGPILIWHAFEGFILLILSLVAIAFSFLWSKKKSVRILSILGCAFVISAVYGGVSFVVSGFTDAGLPPKWGVASSELTGFTGWSFTSQSSSFWEASSRPGLHF